MARGRLSQKTINEILELRFEKKKSVEDIAIILDLSETRVQKEIDKETKSEVDEEMKEDTGSSEMTDSDWAHFWKEKYVEAHVKLLENGLG